jgi:hypothetical protein
MGDPTMPMPITPRSMILMAGIALALAGSPAGATVVLFSDFESVSPTDLDNGGWGTLSSVEGWTGGAAGIEIQTDNVAGYAFSGRNHVELDTYANSSMAVDLAPGRYNVSYWYSARPGVAADSNRIDLTSAGLFLDSVTADGGNATAWQWRSVDFISAGGPLTFAARGTSDSYGGYLDDITITMAAVPEVATWAMLITGFAFVGVAARRRRQDVVAS